MAGPIVHHTQLLPQIDAQPDRPSLMLRGVVYFLIGLSKKVLIADTIGPAIDPFFEVGGTTGAIESLAAITGYSVQLYFDFSGYSDMALGLAAMFGFTLPINFASPYQATSIVEFWRRWHITLSAFLRDYVYIPLGGNQKGRLRRYINLLLTMLIGGLWHGAGWAFVIWGGLHGLALATQHLVNTHLPDIRLGRLATPVTMVLVFCLWVPFRAERMDVTLEIFSGLTNWGGQIDWLPGVTIAIGLVIAFFMPNSNVISPWIERRLWRTKD
ncbi:MAG: MBOAT family O-acyltransferase, partial [Planctomycetota bacterium]|nr:MBOAT family O-acyltransferase [Planctomycetota bacterium]